MSSVVDHGIAAYQRKLFYDACRAAHNALHTSAEELQDEVQEWADLSPSLMDGLDHGEEEELDTGIPMNW